MRAFRALLRAKRYTDTCPFGTYFLASALNHPHRPQNKFYHRERLSSMPAMVMSHDIDPREALVSALGDLKDVDIFNHQVLVATYIRPEKTKSGIFLTDKHREEDRYQSKVGVIVKMGDKAFKDDTGTWFQGVNFDLGDWVVHRASDGWSLTINNVLCRLLDDTAIRARIQHPDTVW